MLGDEAGPPKAVDAVSGGVGAEPPDCDEQYLAGARPDQAPQSPFHGDLRGLPPLLLAVGGDEVLLRDTRRFAEAAAAAGVALQLDVYEEMPHAFHAAVLFPVADHLATASTFLERIAVWVTHLPGSEACLHSPRRGYPAPCAQPVRPPTVCEGSTSGWGTTAPPSSTARAWDWSPGASPR
ncbi:alpha/beta hydrolase [Pseudonocardia nigra]|uniref:alpha/beta hydrolase n=1 Tax=Pseudonocardia nigra TaxID=1921578 RepID=UPI001C5FFD25